MHEVILTEKLQQAAFKTSAGAAEAGAQAGAVVGVLKSLVQSIFPVNLGDASKAVAANGEPTILYHGTTADFSTFRYGLIWLAEDPNYAERGEN